MKKFITSCLSCLFMVTGYTQTVIVKGKIKCLNQSVNSTKGAENVIVVPAFLPSKSTVTASQPSGYFEFNTGLPLSRIQDKSVAIYVVSRCSSCKEKAKRIFISEDQDRRNRSDAKQYVTIKEWMLNTNCQKAELDPFAADSILGMVVKLPEQDLNKLSSVTALTGSPTFLNLLGRIYSVTYLIRNFGVFYLDSLELRKINFGKFLFSSPLYQSANTGFNFSPSRDMSEAALWNPSAIAFSPKPYNISLLTNIRNNVKLTGFGPISKKISISAGGIYTTQNEFIRVRFAKTPPPIQDIRRDSIPLNLKEYAAFVGLVFKVNRKFSLGLAGKSVWQDINIPSIMNVIGNDEPSVLTDSIVKKQNFEIDISATYKITRFLQMGVSFMNLAGTKLYSAPYVPRKPNILLQNQRSLGLGLLYKWKRLNAGVDVLFTEDGLFDAAFGVNYVPFNNALLSAGLSIKELSYSFSFRIKHFRIAYINDNDWMINERKKNGAAILNGRIYGGFVFNLSQIVY